MSDVCYATKVSENGNDISKEAVFNVGSALEEKDQTKIQKMLYFVNDWISS